MPDPDLLTDPARLALLGPSPLGRPAHDAVPLLPAAGLAAMDRALRTGVTRSGTDSAMTLTWIADVAARAAALAGRPVDELYDTLLRHAPDADDIALLAVRVPDTPAG